jgi:hypothetical protein
MTRNQVRGSVTGAVGAARVTALGLRRVFALAAACALLACRADAGSASGAASLGGAGGSSPLSPGGSAGGVSSNAGRSAADGGGVLAGRGGSVSALPVAGASAGAASASGAGGAAGNVVSGGAPAAGVSGSAAGASAGGGFGGSQAASPRLPVVDSTDRAGPFATLQDLSSGPQGQSGVFMPRELGANGVKHPVFLWGCGGTARPSTYATELTRIASHGFVVIAEVANIGDNGAPLKASLDWIIAENGREQSAFFGKVDTSKIGLGGHSIGSVNSFYVAPDPRLTTSIHVAGGSLDDVNDVNAPTTGIGGMNLTHPVAYICSENDTFGNVEKTERDYEKTTVPVFFTIMSGTEHITATTFGLPAIVAWLRWHLAGETERSVQFLEPQGEFCTGMFVSRSKNW